ncbi:MAG: hypothetical protein WDO73_03110 [Ignavibacteriota bacterium]
MIVWRVLISCLLAASLGVAETKAEAALRLQLEAAQRATLAAQQAAASEREIRLKMEAALTQAAKERAALAASVAKSSTTTHQQIAVGQANAKDAAADNAAQQKDATDTIISGQANQSAKTDSLARAVESTKYTFYQSMVSQVPATLAFLSAMAALLVGVLNRRAGEKAAVRVEGIVETQKQAAVKVDEVAVVAHATHSLVNAKFGKVLALLAASARRVADLTGKKADIEMADKAETDRRQHDEEQARVDAGAAITPPPAP